MNNNQKVYSESRNIKRNKIQNKKGEIASKDIIRLSNKSKKESLEINYNNKKKGNLSLNKLPAIGGNLEQYLKLPLNKTFVGTPAINMNNISIKNARKKTIYDVNEDKKYKIVLL